MRRSSSVILCLGFVFGFASLAHAQATRTWVSGVGDDANPCSRTAPCKTFAGTISKTANGGFINVLDSAGYGAVTITKSITIDGEGAHAGIITSLNTGVIINGAGIKVTLRNLSIESNAVTNPGTIGINVINAAEVHIENCWIGRFSSHAIQFHPSAGAEGFINDVTAVSNGGSAVSVVNNSRVSVNRLNAYTNGEGVFVRGNSIATVRDSTAVGGSVGFGANTSAAAVLNLENVVTTHNANGILVASGATVRVSNSMIVSNVTFGLNNGGGGSVIISHSGNTLTGNPTDGSFSSTVAKQ